MTSNTAVDVPYMEVNGELCKGCQLCVELGLLARLVQRCAHLGLAQDGRVAQCGPGPHAQRRRLLEVRVADSHAPPVEAVDERSSQRRQLALVELDLVRFAEQQYHDLVSPGLAGHDQVVDAELIADQLMDERSQILDRAPVGFTAVLPLDHPQARGIDEYDAKRALQGELCSDA